ncbi:MAG: bilirubin reductase [Candidatus Limivicinus sp.]|jgi:2,4-dienoyl-CoA reductase (NADPH2)
MNQYVKIFEPVNYGGITLKNRIIFAPTTMGLFPREYFDKIREIASGGCAMIIIGDVPVSAGKFAPTLFSGKGFEFYSRIAEITHENDCKLCAQLHQNDTVMRGMFKYIPDIIRGKLTRSELRELINGQTGTYISGIPADDVRKITASFGPAAKRAVEAGFDIIQVHGDRMCGSFSSSVFNHRTDNYGGSAENRARFACEAVSAVREALPDIPIDFKLAVRQENPHYGNAGVLEEEIPAFVPMLEAAGVTSFHVTLANHSRLEDTIPPADHPEFSEEGCFLKFCDEVKKYTDLPICGVGGLSKPEFINTQLETGRIDCAAMSRQLIADPDWVNKVRENKTEEIHWCTRCNKKCLGGMYEHKGVHCIYEGEK